MDRGQLGDSFWELMRGRAGFFLAGMDSASRPPS